MGVDKHTLDTCSGIHVAYDVAEARCGTSAGTRSAVNVAQIAGSESDQGVGLVESGDYDFTNFTVLKRNTGIGMADFNKSTV
ncbi:hypothetical protein ADUPG1_004062, partial [Aduncisulcus paluster]